jgi:LmbE family N-acetylglucosaminyl deacetylase
MATAMFFHAHPDDEAIGTGGTMARAAAEGHRVVLVTATRGEYGETPEGLLRPGETLADRRAEELADACDILGVARHEFLGYIDSGYFDRTENKAPDNFANSDPEEAARRLAGLLTEEDAQVLSIYDENGGYGHLDHIQVHRVGARAAELAGTERVYMNTMNRDAIAALMPQAEPLGLQVDDEMREMVKTIGVPEARITTGVDVRDYLDQKRRAMAAHVSQIAETSFFLSMPPEAFAVVWGMEWFVRTGTERNGPMETTLFNGP